MAGEKCAAGMNGSALVIVDVQRDFMPGGARPLDVPEMVIPAIAKAAKSFHRVILLHEWQNDGVPDAVCVAGDAGSESALPRWIVDKAGAVIRNHVAEGDGRTSMMVLGLKAIGIRDIYVAGLNIETSIFSLVDRIIKEGIRAHVIRNGCAHAGSDDARFALESMNISGARIFDLENV